jgi:hypothetical protein
MMWPAAGGGTSAACGRGISVAARQRGHPAGAAAHRSGDAARLGRTTRPPRLVDYRAQGRQSFYFIATPELLDLLRSAEQLLQATDRAVALCPVYGTCHARQNAPEDEAAS